MTASKHDGRSAPWNELKEAGQAGVSVNRMLLLKAQATIDCVARQVR